MKKLWLTAALAATVACSDGDPAPTPVRITAPASPLYVRGGNVRIQVFVDETPERVDLYKDGAPLVNLGPSGPFEYTWYADAAPEAVHRFVARALIRQRWVESAPLEVHVDRTPPRLVATTPSEGATRVPLDTAVTLTFDEALDPAFLVDAATVRVGGVPSAAGLQHTGTGGAYDVLVPGGLTGDGAVVVDLGPPIRDLAGNLLEQSSLRFSLPVWTALGGGPWDSSAAGFPVELLPRGPLVASGYGTFAQPDGAGWRTAFSMTGTGSLVAAAQSEDATIGVLRGAGSWTVQQRGDDGTSGAFGEPIPYANPERAGGDPASVAVSSGMPLVSWSESASIDGAFVSNAYVVAPGLGGVWEAAGPAMDDPTQNWGLEIATAPGHTVAAWRDATGYHAAARTDTGWAPLPKPPGNFSALAVRPDGTPVAITEEWMTTGAMSCSLIELSGGSWKTLGRLARELQPGEWMGLRAVAVHPTDGSVLVAWITWSTVNGVNAPRRVSVALHTTEGFRVLSRGLEEDPAVARYWLDADFHATGAPLVAWLEGSLVHVRRLEP
jgi:hypothetical protein